MRSFGQGVWREFLAKRDGMRRNAPCWQGTVNVSASTRAGSGTHLYLKRCRPRKYPVMTAHARTAN